MANDTSNNDMWIWFNITVKFYFYIRAVIFPLGIIGNVISLFIFTRPSLNCKTNTGLLYTLLCLLNLLNLVYELAGKIFDMFNVYNIELPENGEYFIEIILLQAASCCQALITFDRFVAVFYPIKGAQIMNRKWVLSSVILGLFAFILCVNSPFFIRCPETFTEYNMTFTFDEMCQASSLIEEIVNLLLQFFIPYLLMVTLDTLVIVRLRKLKSHLGGNSPQHSNSQQTSKSSRFTRNTVLIDLIYLIFNSPTTILTIYYTIYKLQYPQAEHKNYEMLFHIVQLIPYIYFSIFFVLFVSFNRFFRAEIFSMIRMGISGRCLNTINNSLS
jgi:hypothetical protein